MKVTPAMLLYLQLGATTFAAPLAAPVGGVSPQMVPAATVADGPRFELLVREAELEQARDGIIWESLVVSPEGRRVAYVTGKGPGLGGVALSLVFMGKAGSYRVVVDGKVSPEYTGVTLPLFSPDGRRVAYGAESGTKLLDALGKPLGRRRQFAVVDAEEGPPYEDVGPVVFSNDGKHFAYGGLRDRKSRIVLDGTEGAPHDGTSLPVFSRDGSRLAYVGHDGERSVLVDGESVTAVSNRAFTIPGGLDWGRQVLLVFNPRDKTRRLAIDGVDGAAYDAVAWPVFSAQGRRLAYAARRAKKWVVVVEAAEGQAWDLVGRPVFSPDGERVAYAARRGKTALVVVDGQAGRTAPLFRAVGEPVFSPDGRSFAYLARDGKQEHVVVNDVPGPGFDAVGALTYSPDGGHLAYEARVDQKWHLVVDGVVGPEYGRVGELPDPETRQQLQAWTFSSPDVLWYVGRRDKGIVRWEVTIGPTVR